MKWFIRLVLLLVFLVLFIPAVLFMVLDPNDYKEDISQLASDQLGAAVRIEGDLGWQVWPSLGLKAGDIHITQPPGFPETDFLSVAKVSFSTQTAPLLRKEIKIDAIELSGVKIHLIRTEQGLENWTLFAEAQSQTQSDADSGSQTESAQSISASQLELDILQLSDVDILFEDLQAGQKLELSDLGFQLDGLQPGQSSQLQFSAKVNGDLEADLQFSSQASLSKDMKQLALNGLNLNLESDLIPGGAIQAKGDLSAEMEKSSVILNQMVLQLLDGAIQMDGTLSAESVQATLQGDGLSLMPLASLIPNLNWQYLSPVGFQATLKGKPDQINLNFTGLKAGELDMKLKASTGKVHQLNFELAKIDLDKIQKTSSTDSSSSPSDAEAPLVTPEQMPDLKLDAKFKIGLLQTSGLKAEQVSTELIVRPQIIRLTNMHADFYQGVLDGDSVIETQGKVVRLQSQGKLSGVQIEPLQQDFMNKAHIRGQTDMNWEIMAPLSNQKAMLEQADGRAQMKFEDGALLGINVAESIRKAYALYKGQTYQPSKDAEETDFSEMSASVKIKDGTADNPDFLLKSPLLRIQGEGQLNLVEQTMDYHVRPVIVGSLKGQNGEEMSELSGVPIPVQINGSLSDPKLKLDLARLLTETQKKKLQKKAEKELFKLLTGGNKKKDKDQDENKNDEGN